MKLHFRKGSLQYSVYLLLMLSLSACVFQTGTNTDLRDRRARSLEQQEKTSSRQQAASAELMHEFITAELRYQANQPKAAFSAFSEINSGADRNIRSVSERLIEAALDQQDFSGAGELLSSLIKSKVANSEDYLLQMMTFAAAEKSYSSPKITSLLEQGRAQFPENSELDLINVIRDLSLAPAVTEGLCQQLSESALSAGEAAVRQRSDAHFYRGVCAEYLQQPAVAEDSYRNAVRYGPEIANNYEALVRILMIGGNTKDALKLINQAEVNSVALNFMRSAIKSKTELAADQIKTYLPLPPREDLLQQYLVNSTVEKIAEQKFALVTKRLLALAASDNDNPQLLNLAATLYLKQNLYDLAIRQYLKVRPESAGFVQSRIAAALVKNRQYNNYAAFELLEETAALLPPKNQTVNLFRLKKTKSFILSSDGKFNQQEKLLRDLINTNPDDPNLKLDLAGALLEQGKLEESVEVLSLLLQEFPNSSDIQNSLAYTYAQSGQDLQKALVMVNKALSDDQDNPYYLDTRAYIYFLTGNFEAAQRDQKLALRELPGDPVLLGHYADILEASGEKSAAREFYQESLAQIDRQETLNFELKKLKLRIEKILNENK